MGGTVLCIYTHLIIIIIIITKHWYWIDYSFTLGHSVWYNQSISTTIIMQHVRYDTMASLSSARHRNEKNKEKLDGKYSETVQLPTKAD